MSHLFSCASRLSDAAACDCPERAYTGQVQHDLEQLLTPEQPTVRELLARLLEAEQAASDARLDLITFLLTSEE